MSEEREIDGIKIVVNGEQYEAYKGTLQDEIKKQSEYIEMLQNNIEKLEKENKELKKQKQEALDFINQECVYDKHLMGFAFGLKQGQVRTLVYKLGGRNVKD